MKKLILFFVIAVFVSNPVFSDGLLNSRFILGNSSTVKIDYFHNRPIRNWLGSTSFLQISNKEYMLVETGLHFIFTDWSIKVRPGVKIKSSKEEGAKFVDQWALVLRYKWKKFTLVSINEITEISINNPGHWSPKQHYYEYDLTRQWRDSQRRDGQIGIHAEAVGFNAYAGPYGSVPVGSGFLTGFFGWRIGKADYKVVAIEYALPIK